MPNRETTFSTHQRALRFSLLSAATAVLITFFSLGSTPKVWAATVTLLRQPNIHSVTPTSLVIVWTTKESGASELRYGVGNYGQTAVANSILLTTGDAAPYDQYYVHEATLTGLTPNTLYQYKIYTSALDITPGSSINFRSGKGPSHNTFRFAALGDSGQGGDGQKGVASRLLQAQPDLILHTGDMVYSLASYKDLELKHFQIYQDLIKSVWLSPLVGNHDYDYNSGKSIADSFVNPPNGATDPIEREMYYSFDYGNAHFTVITSELSFATGSRQYNWVRDDLAATNQFWKIVAFHLPPYYTSSSQGLGTQASNLVSLFEQYDVDVVLTGDRHWYERMKPIRGGQVTSIDNGGILYVVTGGGGTGLGTIGSPPWNSFTAEKARLHHFVMFDVQDCRIEYSAVERVYSPSDTFDPADIFDSFTIDKCSGSSTPSASFSATPTSGPANLTVAFADLSSGNPTSWSWNFGDGQTSTQQNPSHTYTTPGNHTVSLTVSNGSGSNTHTKTNYITVYSTPTPTAVFTANSLNGPAPHTVQFTDQSTGNPTSWSWNFGDGQTATQQSPSHTYTTPGSYTVSLTASNGSGSDSEIKNSYITVVQGPNVAYPIADATVRSSAPTSNYGSDAQLRGRAGSPEYTIYLKFDLSSLSGTVQQAKLRLYVNDGSDNGGAVYLVSNNGSSGGAWTETGLTYGNAPAMSGSPVAQLGVVNTGAWVEVDVTAVVATPGIYSFALRTPSTNSVYYSSKEGANHPQLLLDVVSGPPPAAPTAAFVGNNLTGNAPHTVQFTDQSTDSPTSWSWDFGDGGSSTEQNPSHTYTTPGSYTVVLTASNASGSDGESKTNYITVNAPPPSVPVAAFSGSPVSGSAPHAVQFTDQSTGSPTSWSWDFGDGGSSTQQSPSHTYATPGTYTVALAASNASGSDGESKINYITVTAVPPPSPAQTFAPTADAHVRSSAPTSNYGNDTQLRGRAGSPEYTIYLKFDLSSLSGTVQQAKLRLYVNDGSDNGGAVYLVSNNGSSGSPWTETGLTYGNAPAMSGSPIAQLGTVNTGAWVEVDVTAVVATPGIYSFALRTPSTNSVYYSSKEGANDPQLVITVESGPPPAPVTPTAAFVGNNLSGDAPHMVQFTDQSTDSPTSWSWDFGDGGSSTEQNPSHTYATPGSYTVVLTASNASGSDGESKTNYITVNAPPPSVPVAAFSGSPISGSAPHAVQFTDQSTGSPTSWSWDFGDGGSSTQQSPSHTYATPGTYTVALAASNASGSDGESKINYITVTAVPPPSPAQTFAPIGDTYVKSSSPTSSYGSETQLRGRAASPEYSVYLKFDLSSLSGTVQQAKLRLYVNDGSDNGGAVYLVSNNGSSGSPWTETGLTYGNAPAMSGSPIAQLGTVNTGAWVEVDVTAVWPAAGQTSPGIYSFGISTLSTNSVYYSSKEGSQPPQLIINGDPISAEVGAKAFPF